jgi:hypothetical protein
MSIYRSRNKIHFAREEIPFKASCKLRSTFQHIFTIYGGCVTYRRGSDGKMGFIDNLKIHTTRNYRQDSDIADPHTLHFTVTHVLGSSVFTSRILATVL